MTLSVNYSLLCCGLHARSPVFTAENEALFIIKPLVFSSRKFFPPPPTPVALSGFNKTLHSFRLPLGSSFLHLQRYDNNR